MSIITVDNKIPLVDGKAIESKGTEITDGIVVKARDANGNVTEVDYYGDTVYPWTFGAGNDNGANTTDYILRHLQKINFKNTVTKLKNYAIAGCPELIDVTGLDWNSITETGTTPIKFSYNWHFDVAYSANLAISFANCGITSIEATGITEIPNNGFYSCQALKTAKFPKAKVLGIYTANCFRYCTALETAEFGSIGNAVTSARPDVFANCTQSNLVITAFTTGDKVDTLVSAFRNGATKATIIIKASENTTYNGTAYASGETILTSEVA